MSADIVNLRQARKNKARAAKEAVAAENRERFGRKASDRRHGEAIQALEDRLLEGKRRSKPPSDPE